MSVWVCLPSARPVAEVNARMDKWRERGYKVAMWRDMPVGSRITFPIADSLVIGKYPGVAQAHNGLIRRVFALDFTCEWVVAGADDTDPDPTKTAEEIAGECSEHFAEHFAGAIKRGSGYSALQRDAWATFGVMQPTGDRWGENEMHLGKTGSAYIDRICGSPWIGREFARRVNGGKGPFWPEYFHMFADETMQETALRLGCLWQRRDLIHFHDHCRRDGVARTPQFMKEAYSANHWQKSNAIFERLKAQDFAPCVELAG